MSMKQVTGPLSEAGMLQDRLRPVAQLAWAHMQACVRRTEGIDMPGRLPGTSPGVACVALRATEPACKEPHM